MGPLPSSLARILLPAYALLGQYDISTGVGPQPLSNLAGGVQPLTRLTIGDIESLLLL